MSVPQSLMAGNAKPTAWVYFAADVDAIVKQRDDAAKALERARRLLERIITGDGAQYENLDRAFMVESMNEIASDRDDIEMTVTKASVLEAIDEVLKGENMTKRERKHNQTTKRKRPSRKGKRR